MVISIRELSIFGITILYGLGFWFIMSGARDWWVQNFPDFNTFLVGLIVVFVLIFIYKFRGALPFRI